MTCEGGIPKFLVSLCEALHLNWSIIKNSTEGSSSSADAEKNRNRERFMISFSESLDGLPDLTEISSPSTYSNDPAKKRMMFDQLGSNPNVDFLKCSRRAVPVAY